MDVGASLVAHGEAPVACEPCERPFDDPAMFTQALAGVHTAPSNACLDMALAASLAAARVVIALVRMQLGRSASRSAAPTGSDRRHRIEQRRKAHRVVLVSSRQFDSERNALALDDKRVL